MNLLEKLDYAAAETSAWNNHLFRLAATEIRKLQKDLESADAAYLRDIADSRERYLSCIRKCLDAMESHYSDSGIREAVASAKEALSQTACPGWHVPLADPVPLVSSDKT